MLAHLAHVAGGAPHFKLDEAVEVALPRGAGRSREHEDERVAVVVDEVEQIVHHALFVDPHPLERLGLERLLVEPVLGAS